MSDQAPLVYLIYGIPNSGRRDVLFDLIDGGLEGKEQVLYFRPEGEAASPFDEQIEALDTVSIVDWKLSDATVIHGQIDAAPEKIIFLAPGNCDPADAAEAIKTWTDLNSCQIARIITVVHCAFLSENSTAKAWFDACVHFSDVVLLNRREGVNNKWVKDFEVGYRKKCSPNAPETPSERKVLFFVRNGPPNGGKMEPKLSQNCAKIESENKRISSIVFSSFWSAFF